MSNKLGVIVVQLYLMNNSIKIWKAMVTMKCCQIVTHVMINILYVKPIVTLVVMNITETVKVS